MRLREMRGYLCVCAICVVVSGSPSALAQTPSGILGARRYLQFCAACHGSDGRGGNKAASLVTSDSVRTRSDEDLFRIIHDGTAEGMPAFAQIGEDNIRVLVHFLRILQNGTAPEKPPQRVAIAGDPDAGSALFFGKAQCASCHRMQGKGRYIASDLTAYGRIHNVDAIVRAIVDPHAQSTPSVRVVTVTTKKGQTLTGVLKNEDNFSVDLQTQDGRYFLLDRSQLARVSDSGRSLMPRDYAQVLSPRELDDIAEFLRLAASKTALMNSEQ